MQTLQDHRPLCRCIFEERPVPSYETPPMRHDAGAAEAERPLSLRPDVPCLQRWMDLNA